MILKKPKMVLFDYGNNIIHEDPFDSYAGFTALLDVAVKNPDGVTAAQLCEYNDELYDFFENKANVNEVEVHHHCLFRALFHRSRLEFGLPMVDLETIYWDASAPGRPAPGIEPVLRWLGEQGIPTGVVSNMSFSGECMERRLRARLPYNDFSFVMTSSEYGIRKPNHLLFRAAIGRSGLAAKDIWFCGDNPVADVAGSSAVGMFPVFYRHPEVYPETNLSMVEDIDHLYITHWDQFIPAIEKAK